MQTIRTIDIKGKTVLVRVDLNVPLNDDLIVTDNTRIKAALPTMKHVLSEGGALILMSHLGRPKEREPKFSLRNIIPEIEALLGKKISFEEMTDEGQTQKACKDLAAGDVLLLENLRYDLREKKGDQDFAKFLSSLADVYVNDAFGTAHRAHASTAIIAEYAKQCAFGLLMEKEIENLNKVMEHPESPVTAIIGGAKVSSKIDVIYNLLDKIDHLIIGGGMAYTFIKAQGGTIGNSLFEIDKVDEALEILALAKDKSVTVHLPVDTLITDAFSADANKKIVPTAEIPVNWMGLDIGPKTMENLDGVIRESKTILWNGPMGVFEMEPYSKGTISVAKSIVLATENGAYSLVGGGDSVAALKQFGLDDKVSYVSTGGGAMLEYMEGKVLPGIAALQD
ncbi:MAG: phosphoglycerate kinase [Flavobacteriales bacterium]|nr:phosphoglycerate kinase [Flavobacteriales bacterium]